MPQQRYIGFTLIVLSLALSILGIITQPTAIPFAALFFVVGLVLMWRGRHYHRQAWRSWSCVDWGRLRCLENME